MLLSLFITITLACFSNAQACGSITCGANEERVEIGGMLAFDDLPGLPIRPGTNVVVGWPRQGRRGLTIAYGNPTSVTIGITINSILRDTGVSFTATPAIGYTEITLDADPRHYFGHPVEILITYIPDFPPAENTIGSSCTYNKRHRKSEILT